VISTTPPSSPRPFAWSTTNKLLQVPVVTLVTPCRILGACCVKDPAGRGTTCSLSLTKKTELAAFVFVRRVEWDLACTRRIPTITVESDTSVRRSLRDPRYYLEGRIGELSESSLQLPKYFPCIVVCVHGTIESFQDREKLVVFHDQMRVHTISIFWRSCLRPDEIKKSAQQSTLLCFMENLLIVIKTKRVEFLGTLRLCLGTESINWNLCRGSFLLGQHEISH
jgi:hypothetical protein